MESLFLAQLIGLYLIIVGSIVAFRRKTLIPAVSDLLKNKGLIMVFACIELAAGIALVLTNYRITLDWAGLIALVGWMMLIESIMYLSMPSRLMNRIVRPLNKPVWYITGGLLSVALGAYLTAYGFGLL